MGSSSVAEQKAFLLRHAEGDLIPWSAQAEMSRVFKLSGFAAEDFILQNNFLPARYQRNRNMFSINQQHKLLHSRVAVIGCGGLGGYLIEELARLGIGSIVAVDPDVFVEHNLNRQLLSSIAQLGQPKAVAAVKRIHDINPVVQTTSEQVAFNKQNGCMLLRDADLVVDAMDNVSGRLELAEVCATLDIPFVHGAIAGWYGQVMTVYPGDQTLQKIYRSDSVNKGVETQLGNPSFTPAVIASLQAAEACKVLLGEGKPLRRRKLVIDLLDMEFEEIQL